LPVTWTFAISDVGVMVGVVRRSAPVVVSTNTMPAFAGNGSEALKVTLPVRYAPGVALAIARSASRSSFVSCGSVPA
jgi:hypothetical protein